VEDSPNLPLVSFMASRHYLAVVFRLMAVVFRLILVRPSRRLRRRFATILLLITNRFCHFIFNIYRWDTVPTCL